MKEKGFGKNQADNSLTSCAIYKRDRAVERCGKLFMTFREVLLIGGENVKTQVQQLNEGVSSQRDSLSKCMCANNHTFSKPNFKKKKQLPLKYGRVLCIISGILLFHKEPNSLMNITSK